MEIKVRHNLSWRLHDLCADALAKSGLSHAEVMCNFDVCPSFINHLRGSDFLRMFPQLISVQLFFLFWTSTLLSIKKLQLKQCETLLCKVVHHKSITYDISFKPLMHLLLFLFESEDIYVLWATNITTTEHVKTIPNATTNIILKTFLNEWMNFCFLSSLFFLTWSFSNISICCL